MNNMQTIEHSPFRGRLAGLFQLLRRRTYGLPSQPAERFVQLELGIPERDMRGGRRRR